MPRIKGQPMSQYSEVKEMHSFKLTPHAYQYLSKLAKQHGMRSKAEVIEAIARDDGDLIALPRNLFIMWERESRDKTSPRYERLQQLLEEIKEYLPTKNIED